MYVNKTCTSHGLSCGAGPLPNSVALRLLLLCDVAGDRGCADDRAVRVADRCDGELDRERRSVFSGADGLEVVDRLARTDLGQDGDDLAGAVLGAEQVDGPVDDLLAGVAVHPFGGRVPARDDALERASDAVSYTHLRAHETGRN